jgi:hypothetical protein
VRVPVHKFGKETAPGQGNVSQMGCIAWTGLDGNLRLSDSETLRKKRLKVEGAEECESQCRKKKLPTY